MTDPIADMLTRIRNAVNQQVLNRQPQILNDILGENK